MNSVLNESHNNTNAYEYCVNKAIPDGSNLYYATLYETAQNKKSIISFHAFLFELSEIIQECSDPGVARIKLKWWQEEIERLFNKQPRHPVTRQMQESLDLDHVLQSAIDNTINTFNHFIFIEQTDSLDAILALYKSTAGEIWGQCSQQFKKNDSIYLEDIRELGALIHYVTCLQQPHTFINETRCIIPASVIKHIELQNLLVETDKRCEKQKNVFSLLLSELIIRLNKIEISLKLNHQNMKYELIMAKLAIKTCDEILKDNANILDRNISLTPLRKLWIAWRSHIFD